MKYIKKFNLALNENEDNEDNEVQKYNIDDYVKLSYMQKDLLAINQDILK